ASSMVAIGDDSSPELSWSCGSGASSVEKIPIAASPTIPAHTLSDLMMTGCHTESRQRARRFSKRPEGLPPGVRGTHFDVRASALSLDSCMMVLRGSGDLCVLGVHRAIPATIAGCGFVTRDV